MTHVSKEKIIEEFKRVLTEELQVQIDSAKDAREYATDEDAKAENKYDTRGLEASYLAHGQSQRIDELRKVIGILGQLKIRDFKGKSIEATALIEVVAETDGEEETKIFFMVPNRGGVLLKFEGANVTTVSPESPLGSHLFGAKEGDEFELNIKNGTVFYTIQEVV